MKLLAPDGFERARAWLMSQGRPIDQARFAYHFEGGHAGDVLQELAHYQSHDNGFGRALEPNVRLEASSVIATTVALQILREVDAGVSNPLVHGAIGYLLDQLDREALAWCNVPANVDDAPHAPWWNTPEKPAGFTANPGGEIVGHFHHYASLVPPDLLAQLTDAALAFVRAKAEVLSMHDLFCCDNLRQIKILPQAVRDELTEMSRAQYKRLVETDSAKWTTYCMRPLQAVTSPDSPFMADFADAVDTNLDYMIDTHQPEGNWPPNWNWGDTPHRQAWEQSTRDWQGAIIVNHLCTFKKFGRLAS